MIYLYEDNKSILVTNDTFEECVEELKRKCPDLIYKNDDLIYNGQNIKTNEMEFINYKMHRNKCYVFFKIIGRKHKPDSMIM